MLAYGNRETGFIERSEDVVLESALRWPGLTERPFEPPFHRRDAVLASTAMAFEVVGSSCWSQQAEMPRILGRAFEPELVEVGGKPEEHAQWGRHDEAVVESASVAVGVEPFAPPGVDPRRGSGAASRRRRELYRGVRHPSQSTEPRSRPRGQEPGPARRQLRGHAARLERGGRRRDSHGVRRDVDEDTGPPSAVQHRSRETELGDQLPCTQHTELNLRPVEDVAVEHARTWATPA